MNFKVLALSLLAMTTFSVAANADVPPAPPVDPSIEDTLLDDLNPFDPNIEAILSGLDQVYEYQTGLSADASLDFQNLIQTAGTNSCYRASCKVWARVVKSEQRMYLYVDGQLYAGPWKTSTGTRGHSTPNFDTHPNGRIYNRYTSTKYPGGDYNGLGNMPYAVFIKGGFAIHGTGRGNWPKLGSVASHGCIRIHPDNAIVFNQLVRQAGVRNTWITVE